MSETSSPDTSTTVSISSSNRTHAADIVRRDMNAEQHVDWREHTLVIRLIKDSTEIRQRLIQALAGIVPDTQIHFIEPGKKSPRNNIDAESILNLAPENDGVPSSSEVPPDWNRRTSASAETAEMSTSTTETPPDFPTVDPSA